MPGTLLWARRHDWAALGRAGSPQRGAYVGDDMLPLPAKLVNKIRRWEFIEMGELLPEFWVGPKEAEGESGKEKRVRQGRKDTDIFTWLQCFGTYIAVLAKHELALVPELMAYMGLIIRVSQDYECLGCVRYDSAFRRQAGPVQQQEMVGGEWHSIHNEFLGEGVRHEDLQAVLCHLTQQAGVCSERQSRPGRWRSAEEPGVSLDRHSQATAPKGCLGWQSATAPMPQVEHIRQHLSQLQHMHACSSCGGNHPAIRCGDPSPTPRFMATRPPHRPY